VVPLPSGYAILKVLAHAPALEDLNPTRVMPLISMGVIPQSGMVGGYPESLAAMRDTPKPEGWPRNQRQVCVVRDESVKNAKQELRNALQSTLGTQATPERMKMILPGESALARLYGFSGEMPESIEAWKAAVKLAETADPGYLPNQYESIGATYLH
jgi:hypothetical protein